MGSSSISTSRLHGNHARDGHPALLPAGELEGGLLQQIVAAGPRSSAASRTRRSISSSVRPMFVGAEGDVLVDRLLKELILRILEHQPHLEAHVRVIFLVSAQMSFPSQQHLAGGGLQQAVEVLDQGGLAGAGVADDAQEFPLGRRRSSYAPRRCAGRACPRRRYGSDVLTSMIGSNVVPSLLVSFSPEPLAMASAHSSTVRGVQRHVQPVLPQPVQQQPPCPARSGPWSAAAPPAVKTSCGVPSSDDAAVVHDDDPVGLLGLVHVVGDEHHGDALLPVQALDGRQHLAAGPTGSSMAVGLVQHDALRLHGDARPRWPRAASVRRRAGAARA